MAKDGKRRVFFTASTINGTKIQGIAFGMKNESLPVIAMRGYKLKTDSPVSIMMVFESADDYFLGKMPVKFTLSEEIQERAKAVRCFEHLDKKVRICNGLPDCFECREDLLIGV